MKNEDKRTFNIGTIVFEGVTYCQLDDMDKIISEKFEQFQQSLTSTLKEVYPNQDNLLNVEQAALFLDVDQQTVHNRKNNRKIPYRRIGKRIYFLKSELIEASKLKH